MKLDILVVAGALALAWPVSPSRAGERVVSAGGAVTETIYALGAENSLVGVDTSSVFPEAAAKLAQIGYSRQLSAEGILSLRPSKLIASAEAGPPAVLEQLAAAKVELVRLGSTHTPEATVERIEAIGVALGKTAEAAELVNRLKAKLDVVRRKVAALDAKPRILFIYARAGGVMNVSGRETAADAMIALAGGVNAVTEYDGYKPLTAEAAVAARPDVILVTTRGLESCRGIDGLLEAPGLKLTPAGRNRRVLAMDDLYLLGFGPRLGEAVSDLCDQLHPRTSSGPEAAMTKR